MRSVFKLFFPSLICFVSVGSLRAEESPVIVQVESPREPAPSTEPRRLNLEIPQKWNVKGVFRTEFQMYQKPSGYAGNSEFHIPYADLEVLGQIRDNLQLDVELSHTSPVTSQANPNNAASTVAFQRLAVNLHPKSLPNLELNVGLIEPAFSRFMKEDWAYDNLNADMFWPGARWGYWFASDYGVQLSQFDEVFSGGIGIVNGEGPMKQSQRAQKDAYLWADFKFASNGQRQNHFLIHVLRGAYDNIPSADASKDRMVLSLWSRAKKGFSLGGEFWSLRDPADAITGKAAGGVDLTIYGGQRVKGQIFSSHGSYRWGQTDDEQFEVFYRSDRVDPVTTDKNLSVTADHFGIDYSPQAGLDWILMYSDLDYGIAHSTAARDQQLWRLSFNVTWD